MTLTSIAREASKLMSRRLGGKLPPEEMLGAAWEGAQRQANKGVTSKRKLFFAALDGARKQAKSLRVVRSTRVVVDVDPSLNLDGFLSKDDPFEEAALNEALEMAGVAVEELQGVERKAAA